MKLYVREPGTDLMLRLASEAPANKFTILSLATVEFHAAVRRRERGGDFDTDTAVGILAAFSKHLTDVFIRQPITEATVDMALQLVDRHALRAYDALQLAGCLLLPQREPSTFVCSDVALTEAARAEGLPALDPADQAV